jgi:hypothetical protein
VPEYVNTAPYPMAYPESKDAQGRNLGLVRPGDIRDLDEAPDRWWREAADEDRARLAARQAEVEVGSAGELEGLASAAEDAARALESAEAALRGGDGDEGEGAPAPGDEAPPSAPEPPAVIPGT